MQGMKHLKFSDGNTFFFFLILSFSSNANFSSQTGGIEFKSNNSTTDMTITSTGLGIGVTPSSNLHVSGNTLIEKGEVFIGGTSGSSTLNINGSIGFRAESISSNTVLSSNTLILVDTSGGNIVLEVPEASDATGRIYHVKKTSSLNDLYIANSQFDNVLYLQLKSSEMGHASLVSSGSNWYIIGMSGNTSSVSSDNLIAWWKLNDSSGTIATDSGANDMDGTVTGASFSSNSMTGQIGTSLDFNGSNSYILVPNGSVPNSFKTMTETTWACFLKPGALSEQYLINNYKGGGDETMLRINVTGINFQVYLDDDVEYGATSGNVLVVDTWYHLAGTFDGLTSSIYLNGKLEMTKTTSGANLDFSGANGIHIGSRLGSSNFVDGMIDEIMIFDRALNLSEIKALSNLGQ